MARRVLTGRMSTGARAPARPKASVPLAPGFVRGRSVAPVSRGSGGKTGPSVASKRRVVGVGGSFAGGGAHMKGVGGGRYKNTSKNARGGQTFRLGKGGAHVYKGQTVRPKGSSFGKPPKPVSGGAVAAPPASSRPPSPFDSPWGKDDGVSPFLPDGRNRTLADPNDGKYLGQMAEYLEALAQGKPLPSFAGVPEGFAPDGRPHDAVVEDLRAKAANPYVPIPGFLESGQSVWASEGRDTPSSEPRAPAPGTLAYAQQQRAAPPAPAPPAPLPQRTVPRSQRAGGRAQQRGPQMGGRTKPKRPKRSKPRYTAGRKRGKVLYG